MTSRHYPIDKDSEEGILKGFGLKKTVGRIKILGALHDAGRPLTGNELCAVLGRDSMDPASIYRALSLFSERGIVHRIGGDDRAARFALTKGGGDHPHFVCRNCGRMDCLNDVSLPEVNVSSRGYLVEQEHLFLSGLCDHCKKTR
jgi:Fur family ferric uptake transcriptional regulator